MTKKIGRNDPCPCGSGKKYKVCCLEKREKEKYLAVVFESSKDLKRESREKQCVHPDHDKCSEKIVKAHAIQNNRVLKKIAVNGEIITVDGQSHFIFQNAQMKGRKVATTFTGFCGYHDKITFQDIEDREFEGTTKQIFLFTYRTMAWHYHKKMEQANAFVLMRKKMEQAGYRFPENSPVSRQQEAFELGKKDNLDELKDFNVALMAENYTIVSSYIWEIPYEVSFAISMMHEIAYDIDGQKINDLERTELRPKKIYLNIFPVTGKSFCIWSWLAKWDKYVCRFTSLFDNLSQEDRINYFNNNLPRWSDALVISPRLWEKWGEQIQDGFISHANFDSLYIMNEKEMNKHAYEYMDTPWNLFEHID